MSKLRSRTFTCILIAAALAALIFGLWRGEALTVFSRAAHICLECIGLG
ncbi:MAG: CD1871A family CXXC motif-containing protein [Bacillota bacterium]|nr:CD1871A family CXXC motif-containing protein [Bacillota bacterium]